MKCNKCNLIKNEYDFTLSMLKKMYKVCKICDKEYKTLYYEKNKNEILKQTKENYFKNKEKISKRSKEKRKNNKELYKKMDRDNYLRNKEKKSKRSKEYNIKNKEKISKRHQQYYLENSDVIKKRSYEFKINKKQSDVIFKLKSNISNYIYKILKNNKRNLSIINYVNWTVEELRKHIEYYFSLPGNEWMNWDNYGSYKLSEWNDNDKTTWKWHLDHIIPHSHFNYISMEDEEFRKCWSLDNLRPYNAKQNIIDGDRR